MQNKESQKTHIEQIYSIVGLLVLLDRKQPQFKLMSTLLPIIFIEVKDTFIYNQTGTLLLTLFFIIKTCVCNNMGILFFQKV